jgi:hypothetical protein
MIGANGSAVGGTQVFGLVELALGCLIFSVIASALHLLRATMRRPKSPYEKWLEEVEAHDILHKGGLRQDSRVLNPIQY